MCKSAPQTPTGAILWIAPIPAISYFKVSRRPGNLPIQNLENGRFAYQVGHRRQTTHLYQNLDVMVGRVAQWIRRLTTDQAILGSSPGTVEDNPPFFFLQNSIILLAQGKKRRTIWNEKPNFCLSTTSKLFFAVLCGKAQRGLQTKHLVVFERDWANLEHRCPRTVRKVRRLKQNILVFVNNGRPSTSHMV